MTMTYQEDLNRFVSSSLTASSNDYNAPASGSNLRVNLMLIFNNTSQMRISRLKSAAKFLCIKFFNSLWINLPFVVLVLVALLQIYDLNRSYAVVAMLVCPIKTWMLGIAFYLRYKCLNLNINDFNKFIDTSKYRHSITHSNQSMRTESTSLATSPSTGTLIPNNDSSTHLIASSANNGNSAISNLIHHHHHHLKQSPINDSFRNESSSMHRKADNNISDDDVDDEDNNDDKLN